MPNFALKMDILLNIITLAFVVNLAYWLYLFLGFPMDNQVGKHNENPFVSIVITARNEERNLIDNLPLLLALDYPNFEIIVIDDDSTDNTRTVLSSFDDHRLKFRSIQNSKPGKRDALRLGTSMAQGEYMLLTDADCRPNGKNWIKSAMSLRDDADIGLLYGPIIKRGGWLNLLVRYETMVTAIQYFTFAVKAKRSIKR